MGRIKEAARSLLLPPIPIIVLLQQKTAQISGNEIDAADRLW